jgi:poly(3-hydroxybutyrate) depolymerase
LPQLLLLTAPQLTTKATSTTPRVQHRSYTFEPTGESIPYAIFVPSSYDPKGTEALPLLVSLHGLGRSYDWLMGYHGLLDQAEESGYAVVTPLGYIREGWFGSRPAEDPQDGVYSEQDVMNVLELVRDELRIDSDRIFLWGHSMGGGGTYHIAAKHPDVFAGLGVAAPAPAISAPMDEILDKIAHLPIFILQGDQDDLVPVLRRVRGSLGWPRAVCSTCMSRLKGVTIRCLSRRTPPTCRNLSISLTSWATNNERTRR